MKAQTIITIIVSVFGATGFWSLVQSVLNKLLSKKSVQSKATLGLLHYDIFKLCNEYIERGWITISEYDNLQYLYTPYEKMGGNGTAKKLMLEIKGLPIYSDDSAPKGGKK